MELKTTFCQSLKIKILPESHKLYYDELQADLKKMRIFFATHSGLNYSYKEDENDSEWKIASSKKSTLSPEAQRLIDIIAKGGIGAEHAYGIFYKDKKVSDKIRRDNSNCIFAMLLPNLVNFEEEYKKRKSKLQLTKEEWEEYHKRCLAGESVEVLWSEEIAPKIGPNEAARLASLAYHQFPDSRHPADITHCRALMSMVADSFCSWVECHKLHREETEKLKTKLQEKIESCKEAYNLLLAYSEDLYSRNYGLSARVLKALIDNKSRCCFDIAFQIAEKYPALMKIDEKTLFKAYNALKLHWKIKRRKPFISLPKIERDYQVPFGLTGSRGKKFDVYVENKNIVVEIDGQKVETFSSHYFSDMQISKIYGEKKNLKGFKLKFRHKLKDKKKEVYGEWIEAELKEIKIKKDMETGDFYLYLPYTTTHNEKNLLLEKFFSYADPLKETIFKNGKTELPNEFLGFGFDLNLSDPIAMAVAEFVRDSSDGEIGALDYGHGKLLDASVLVCNSSLSKRINDLVGDNRKLIQAIRSYKNSLVTKEMDEESGEWLKKALGNAKYGNHRHQLQLVMSKLNKKSKKYWQECRKNGHNDLSENIALLKLLDVQFSLHKSYNNIHIFDYKKQIHSHKTDSKRENFREFVTKQFAATIVKHCKEVMAKYGREYAVVFLEDLEMYFDADADNNSLIRLFAPGQLKKYIASALAKSKIGYVFIPPAGTSKTDPLTSKIGFRATGKYYKQLGYLLNKSDLYVERNGVIGKINSDVAAAINILLKGVNHSIVPYRFLNKHAGSEQKRLKRFEGEIGCDLKKMPKTRLYYLDGKIITEEEKNSLEEALLAEIKHFLLSKANIPEFDAIPGSNGTCKAFSVPRCLK